MPADPQILTFLRGITIVAIVAVIALVIYRMVAPQPLPGEEVTRCPNRHCGCHASADGFCHCHAGPTGVPHHHDPATGSVVFGDGVGVVFGAPAAAAPSVGAVVSGSENQFFTNYRDILGPFTSFRAVPGIFPGYSTGIHPMALGASPEMAWLMANQRAQEERAAQRACPPMPPARRAGNDSPTFRPLV